VTYCADEARTQPLLGFDARQRKDLAATDDVKDERYTWIGGSGKEFAMSLPARCSGSRASLPDRYDVELPASPHGWRLNRRVGAAMAVALDAPPSRCGHAFGVRSRAFSQGVTSGPGPDRPGRHRA
jgi:hypothetical protein